MSGNDGWPKRARTHSLFTGKRFPARTKKDSQQDAEIRKLKKQVKKLKPELKHHGVYVAGTAYGNTGTVVDLDSISQGLTDLTRIGDKIRYQWLDFKCHVGNTSATNSYVQRIVLVLDKQNRLGSGTISDLFVRAGQPDVVDDLQVDDNKAEYKILLDKRFTIGGQGERPAIYSFRKKLSNTEVAYDGGGTAPLKNSLKIVFFTDAPVAGNTSVTAWHARLYYSDN